MCAEAKKLGKKALVVTGKKSMERLSFLQKSIDFIEKEGLEVVHCGEVNSNPTIDIVDKGAEKAIDSRCDVVVGFGSGSAKGGSDGKRTTAKEILGSKILRDV